MQPPKVILHCLIGSKLQIYLFEYVDLKVDERKFEDMTIRLGPKVTEAEKVIVQSLVKEFNPSAKIEDSVLKVR